MADYIIVNGELYHHGVIGMKWGRRRYQNKDGTLTAAGKKRYDKEMEKAKAEQKVLKNKERTQAKLDKLEALKKDNEDRKSKLDGPSKAEKVKQTAKTAKKKRLKEMTDDEIQAKIDRMRLEDTYKQLMESRNPPQSKEGRDFVKGILKKTGENMLPQFGNYMLAQLGNAALNKFDKSKKNKDGTWQNHQFFTNNKKKS